MNVFPPGYVTCTRWMAEFINAWLEQNPMVVTNPPKFFEIQGTSFIGELNRESIRLMAENESALRLMQALLDAAPPEYRQKGLTLLQFEAAFSFVLENAPGAVSMALGGRTSGAPL